MFDYITSAPRLPSCIPTEIYNKINGLLILYFLAVTYRLAGVNSTRNEGRVDVYHRSEWSPICQNGFGDPEVAVICHSLGFVSGTIVR